MALAERGWLARRDDDVGVIPRDEAPPAAPGGPEYVAPDPDRVLRTRIVLALATLITGSVTALFAAGLFAFALSGRVGLLFAAGALPLATGAFALLVRAPLRALLAARPDNDELRSLTGFVSLACAFVLLGASAVFLVFTFSVLLAVGGAVALYVLPLIALAFFTLQFIREATDDFLKRTVLRREVKLFVVSLAYFALTALVFVLLASASTVSPVRLVSPADGATVCTGTALDFEVGDPNVVSLTWDNGTSPQPLAAPYDVHTTGWADGNYTITVNATDSTGASTTATFRVTLRSDLPTCG